MTDLSILLVNYNTRDLLQACITSIFREQGTLSVQIVVVDNGSKDGSVDMLRTTFGDRITLITPPANTWFTGGNNLALAHAVGEYAFILNCDTMVLPNTLQTMLAYLQAHPDLGAVTCRMEYPNGAGVQRTCSRVPAYLDLLLGYTLLGVLLAPLRDARRRAMWYADWQRDSTRTVEVAPGSCIMARRETLLAMGGCFDDALKLYFPEDDLCQRLKLAGMGVHFVAEATLIHHEHASVAQVQRLASQIYFDDLLTFCRKWYGTGRTWLLRALLTPTRWVMDTAQRLRGERVTL